MCKRVNVAGCRICEMVGIDEDSLSASPRQGETQRYAGATYHEAVEWFKALGYTVEPGPGVNEVTLINDQRPDFIAHHTVPAGRLAEMADLSQIVTAQQLFRPKRRGRGSHQSP